jgi:hypothetical protein
VESLGIGTLAFGAAPHSSQRSLGRAAWLWRFDKPTGGMLSYKREYATHAVTYLLFRSLERALIIFVRLHGFASSASSRFQQSTDFIVTEFPFAYLKPPHEPFLPPWCGLDN